MDSPEDQAHPDAAGDLGRRVDLAAAMNGATPARAEEPATHPVNGAAPRRHMAIVTCMDSRIDIFHGFGIEVGDAHIIRNAGGIITDDVIRSLMVSQRFLGTTEIIVMQHTECGLFGLDDAALREQIRKETGMELPFTPGGFTDLEASVRAGVARLRSSPLLQHRDNVRGFVYDVRSHQVRRVADIEAPGVGR